MNYLLDSHAAIWLLEGSAKLGARAKAALAGAGRESVAICDISLLEIAMLATRGTISLRPNIPSALDSFAAKLSVLPIDAAIAAAAPSLPLPHPDPFDRVITAAAQLHGLTLITKDRHIRGARLVPTLW